MVDQGPEGEEERTLKAAETILGEGIAQLVLIGNPDTTSSTEFFMHSKDEKEQVFHNCYITDTMPIISDLLSSIVIGMTGIENAAYISYFKLMEDVTRANPDSTQNVVSYVVLTAITIFFAAASAIVLRKEDIN